MDYHLAIDIGASSGRCIIGWLEHQQLKVQEIHRFHNGIIERNGHSCWDIEQLYQDIIQGLKQCRKQHKIPKTMAIDTWSCDYVLLDEQNQILGDAVAYRDARCDGVMQQVLTNMDRDMLYEHTGIQFQKFNTLYQLIAQRTEDEESFAKADCFLMIPDYLQYRLSGIKGNEYSNASTTQLLHAKTKMWDEELLQQAHLPRALFQELYQPGDRIGSLQPLLCEEVGFSCEILACASHDTASAFAISHDPNSILISSGTWSLLGVLVDEALCSKQAQQANFTNEGGTNHKIRFLKNIMGLWMIQEVQRLYEDAYSFQDLVSEARKASACASLVDVFDDRFLHPTNMIHEIQAYCKQHHLQVPQSVGEIAYCIYHSLAVAYHATIQELEEITQKQYDSIHIFGGGCQNELLNELVSKICKKRVYAGPSEATAIGNLLVQMHLTEPSDIEKISQSSWAVTCYEGGYKL